MCPNSREEAHGERVNRRCGADAGGAAIAIAAWSGTSDSLIFVDCQAVGQQHAEQLLLYTMLQLVNK